MSQSQGDYSHCVDVELDEGIGNSHSKQIPDEALEQFLEDDKDGRSVSSTVQRWYGKVVNPVRRMLIPIRQKLRRSFHGKSWRFGLFAGIYTSLVVLLGNITMLVLGFFVHGGYVDGIATIAQGNIHDMEWISTLYHVFINVFSTVLLTSSNYTMQLLCAPTRIEVDDAHRRGQWMDIGLMSFYNLRHINKKRVILWAALALSSIPLHLLFNAAIFQSNSRQDYQIDVVNMTNIGNNTDGWKVLTNSVWSHLYSIPYVAGYGDLRLVVQNASFEVRLDSNWGISLNKPSYDNTANKSEADRKYCDWKPWLINTPVPGFQIQLDTSTGTVSPVEDGTGYRLVVDLSSSPIDSYLNDSDISIPQLNWPQFRPIYARDKTSIVDDVTLCSDSTSWMAQYPFQIQYALAQPTPYASRVHMALPFVLVVIAANFIKTAAFILTLRTCSTGHIVTIGDAISSFLESPENNSAGKCTLSKQKLVHPSPNMRIKPWHVQEKLVISVIGGGHGSSALVLLSAVVITLVAFVFAIGEGSFGAWGTSSSFIITATESAPTAGGVLKNAWLANLPQFVLSVVYFMINRICTSICSAQEWNNYALHRKGLRVTETPRGFQKSTHFLQLPYRWAVPLTVTQGFLHWLLSQSIFLVRVDMRNREGELYPTSICACGYSPRSLAVFTLIFLGLISTILFLVLRYSIQVYLPPVQHCSAIISAACHPPPDDQDANIRKVQWGVVSTPGSIVEHCTFTSHEVSLPKDGTRYA